MNKIRKITLFLIIIPFVLFVFYPTISANAQGNTVTVKKDQIVQVGDGVSMKYIGLVDGKRQFKLLKATVDGDYLNTPFIPEYIKAMYEYGIIVITILATVMLIVAGLLWTISGGNTEQIGKAKKIIARSITGLVIAVGSYTLLYAINPQLVEFESLKILRVGVVGKGSVENPNNPGGDSLVPLPKNNLIKYQNTQASRVALPIFVENFEKAIKEYGKSVKVTGMLRTAAEQYTLLKANCGCVEESTLPLLVPEGQWSKHCTKLSHCGVSYNKLKREGGKFIYTKNYSHFAGNAIDMETSSTGRHKPCANLNSCEKQSNGVVSYGSIGQGYCIPKEQQLLIKAMLNNGFCVGLRGTLRESWHFEHTDTKVELGGFCTKDKNYIYLKKLWYLNNPESDETAKCT